MKRFKDIFESAIGLARRAVGANGTSKPADGLRIHGEVENISKYDFDSLYPFTSPQEIPEEYIGLGLYYKKSAWVFACINEIARAASSLAYRLMTWGKDANGKRVAVPVEDDSHPLLKLLEDPNPYQVWYDVVEAHMWYMEVWGSSFWEKSFLPGADKTTAPPVALFVLKPDMMSVIPDSKKFVRSYVYKPNFREITFSPNEILHFKYFNPESEHIGFAPIQAAKDAIETDRMGLRWNKNMLKNFAMQGLVLESDRLLPKVEIKRLRKEIEQLHEGPEKAYRTAILHGGMKAKSITYSPKDVDFATLRKIMREEELAVMDVPPIKVGLLEFSNYANAKEQNRTFYQDAVFPRVTKMIQKLNKELVPLFGDNIWLEPDFSQHLQTSEEQQAVENRAILLKREGLLTEDEAREMIGKSPLTQEQKDEIERKRLMATNPFAAVQGGGLGGANPEAGRPDSATDLQSPEEEAEEPQTVKSVHSQSPIVVKEQMFKDGRFTEYGKEEFFKGLGGVRDNRSRRGRLVFEGVLRAQYKAVIRQLPGRFSKADPYGWVGKLIKDTFKKNLGKIGGLLLVTMKDTSKDVQRSVGLDFSFNQHNPAVVKYLRKAEIKLSREINGTTEGRIRKVLVQGVKEGRTIEDMTESLEKLLDTDLGFRPNAIARTEITSATNFGALETYEQSGVIEKKEWLTSIDGREREDHHNADGQIVSLDDAFQVGGERLMHPGDPSASAGNRINCRCTVAPVIEGNP